MPRHSPLIPFAFIRLHSRPFALKSVALCWLLSLCSPLSAQTEALKKTLSTGSINTGFDLPTGLTLRIESGASIIADSGSTVTGFGGASGYTASRLIVSDGSGNLAVSAVTATEAGYLSGVTSVLQTQMDAKLATATAASTYAPIASPTFTGTVTIPTGAAITSPAITTSITTPSTSFTALAGATTLLTLGGTGATATIVIPGTEAATGTAGVGALSVAGGLNVVKDAWFNGVRVGLGGGAITTNTAVGAGALNATATGGENTAVGKNALAAVLGGSGNVALGTTAGLSITTGTSNTLLGYESGALIVGGTHNVAVGADALVGVTSASDNVAIGYVAGSYRDLPPTTSLANPSDGVYIGSYAIGNADGETNAIVIGYDGVGEGSNTTVIGNSNTTSFHPYGTVLTAASTTTRAGLRLAHGSAPTSPTNGDVWTTTAGMYARINGATVGPLSTGVSDGDKGDITVSSSGAAFAIDASAVTDAMLAGSITPSKITGTAAILGANTFTAAQVIDGSADAVQLTVQGHSTQTSNILLIEKSDGTDLLTLSNTGAATIIGTLAAGASNTVSGTNATALGISNTASGNYSLAAGSGNTAAVLYGVALGYNNNNGSSSGSQGNVLIGYANYAAPGASSIGNVILGSTNILTTTSVGSLISGLSAYSYHYNARAHSVGDWQYQDPVQFGETALWTATSNATPTEAFIDGTGGSKRFTLIDGQTYDVELKIVARKSDGSQCASYWRRACIKRVGSATSLVGSVATIGTDIEDDAAWDVTIDNDDTNESLRVQATGAAATDIRWVFRFDFTLLNYP